MCKVTDAEAMLSPEMTRLVLLLLGLEVGYNEAFVSCPWMCLIHQHKSVCAHRVKTELEN